MLEGVGGPSPGLQFGWPGMTHTCLYYIDLLIPATSTPACSCSCSCSAMVWLMSSPKTKLQLSLSFPQSKQSTLVSDLDALYSLPQGRGSKKSLHSHLPLLYGPVLLHKMLYSLAGEPANSPSAYRRGSYCANQAQLPSVSRAEDG